MKIIKIISIMFCIIIQQIIFCDEQNTENENFIKSFFRRTFTSVYGTLTINEDFNSIGAGGGYKTMTFLSQAQKSGLYLLILVDGPFRFLHPNKVEIDDTKLIGIGWRDQLFHPFLGYNASIAVTLGSRRIDNTVLGDIYIGLSPEIGLIFFYDKVIDFEISFNPNFNIFAFDELAENQLNEKIYYDIAFQVTYKQLEKIFTYTWN